MTVIECLSQKILWQEYSQDRIFMIDGMKKDMKVVLEFISGICASALHTVMWKSIPFQLPKSGGIILLVDHNDIEKDTVIYNSDWPIIDGHSLRLHSPDFPNIDFTNWSPSPITERSERLYDDVNTVRNFGSPGEENSFELKSLVLNNSRCNDSQICSIDGDYNNIYIAAVNNYSQAINFSWVGTFAPPIAAEEDTQSYKIIINKLDSWKPEMHGFYADTNYYNDSTYYYSDSIVVSLDLPINGPPNTSVLPKDLSIHQLEIANYSWRVELTKGDDTIYSDIQTFKIDASDYGVYGCVDDGSCTDGGNSPTCPTSADDSTLVSNYPAGCTPGVDCFQALNYFYIANTINNYASANIHSDICQYGALSIPKYILGNVDDTNTESVYLDNRDGAKINKIGGIFRLWGVLGCIFEKCFI